MATHLSFNKKAVTAFCQRHGIRKLSFFGSVLRDDFDPQRSDIDVLAEFEPVANKQLTYFALARIAFELESILGHKVDLSLADSLDPQLRNQILTTAEEQYVAA